MVTVHHKSIRRAALIAVVSLNAPKKTEFTLRGMAHDKYKVNPSGGTAGSCHERNFAKEMAQ